MILAFAGVSMFIILVAIVVGLIIAAFVVGAGQGSERRRGGRDERRGSRPRHTEVSDDPHHSPRPRS